MRITSAAVALAKEARRRGIPMVVDVEKDRGRLETSGSPPKDLFVRVREKAEFFGKALARGESVSAVIAAWKPQMGGNEPGETRSDQEEKLEVFRYEHGRNPSFTWQANLGTYRALRVIR